MSTDRSSPAHPTEPTVAEHARTALATARAATLLTKGCPARQPAVTLATVDDQSDGRPLVGLDAASPAIKRLAECRVATITVPAPAPFRGLELTGVLAPSESQEPEVRVFRLDPLACRLTGAAGTTVPISQFRAAAPDPLRHLAPDLLTHLADAHGEDLLACIRAHASPSALAAIPRAVDRYGIELTILDESGTEWVRLPFPNGPIDALHELPPGLLLPLTCRCERKQSHPPGN